MRMFHVGILFTASSFALGVTLPVMSLLLLDKGLSLSTLALVMGAYGIVVIASEIPSGIIGDRYGRNVCFILAKAFSAAGSIFLVFARTPLAFTCAILLMGLARAFISGSFEALAIDWHNRQFGIGALHRITTRIAIWDTVGLSAGSLASGFIAIWSARWFDLPGRYDGNFLFSAALNLTVALLALLWVTEPAAVAAGTRKEIGIRSVLRQVASNGLLAYLMAASAATGFILSSIEKYWQPQFLMIASGNGTTTVFLGLLAFIGFMSALAGTVLSGHVIAKNARTLPGQLLLWRVVMVMAIILLSRMLSRFGFGLFYGLFYLSMGLYGIAEQVMFNRLIPAHLRASLLSGASFAMQAGGFAASAVAAMWLADNTRSIGSLWMLSAAVVALTLVPLVVRRKQFGMLSEP